MMKLLGRVIAATIAAALLPPAAHAAKIGDPAKPLVVAEWVKGAPVDLAAGKGKNVYVVEFWATWCPPCRESIPHLTEMQKKYQDKDVVFIGVTAETPDEVKPFVKKMGPKMDYHVAVDKDNQTTQGYMAAYNQNGIPTAFIVNQEGRVIWYGHPMGGLEQALAKVVAGKFDVAAAVKEKEEEARRAAIRKEIAPLFEEYFTTVTSNSNDPKASKLGEKIFTKGSSDPMVMNALAWNIMDIKGIKNRDLALALKAAKAAHDATSGENADVLDTYARALFENGKIQEAVNIQKKAVEIAPNAGARAMLQKNLDKYERQTAASR